MSAHYIYLSCTNAECDVVEAVYTGGVTTEDFPDSGPESFEGEFITVPCNKHLGEVPTSKIDDLGQARLACQSRSIDSSELATAWAALALAEEQRTANLIALANSDLRVANVDWPPVVASIVARLGLVGDPS